MSPIEPPTFPGLVLAPAPRDRLFFAVLPPPEIAERIFKLARRLKPDLRLTGRPVTPGRLHATLYALEPRTGVSEALVGGLSRAAVRVEVSSFEVSFSSLESFRTKPVDRPLVLRGKPEDLLNLAALRRQLVNGLVAAGLVDPRFVGWFTPHVTLLYDDRAIEPTPIEPIRWTVRDFVLVHSHVGRSRHDVLGRWPLAG